MSDRVFFSVQILKSLFLLIRSHTLPPFHFPPPLSFASRLKNILLKSVVCFKSVEAKCQMSYYGVTQSRVSYQAPSGPRSSSAPSFERTPLSRSGSHTNVYSRGSSIAPTANSSTYYSSAATNFEVFSLSLLC